MINRASIIAVLLACSATAQAQAPLLLSTIPERSGLLVEWQMWDGKTTLPESGAVEGSFSAANGIMTIALNGNAYSTTALVTSVTSYCIEFWAKLSTNFTQGIASMYQSSYGPDIHYRSDLNRIVFVNYGPGGSSYSVANVTNMTAICDVTTWNHYAFTYRCADSNRAVFVNGISRPYTDVSSGSVGTQITNVTWKLAASVGRNATAGSQFSQFRMWSREVSSAEILEHAAGGFP